MVLFARPNLSSRVMYIMAVIRYVMTHTQSLGNSARFCSEDSMHDMAYVLFRAVVDHFILTLQTLLHFHPARPVC